MTGLPPAAEWNASQRTQWARIQAHPLENASHVLDFCRRLARDHGWTMRQARAAVVEYQRFCFLCTVEPQPLTPSVEVDEVWHLHLTYSRDYWGVFCPEVLGMPLHHGPTVGGAAEGERYRDQYGDTLRAYERWFGDPPDEWWPSRRERFRCPQRFVWIDRQAYWLCRKQPPGLLSRVAISVLASGFPAASAAAPVSVFDWPAAEFLQLYAIAALLALLLGGWIRWSARASRPAPGQPALSTLQMAYLAGASERAAETVVAALLSGGHVRWNSSSARLEVTEHAPPGDLAAAAQAIAADGKPSVALRRIERQQRALAGPLARRELCLTPERRRWVAQFSALPGALVVGAGIYRTGLGIVRDRPVGYLVTMTVLLAMIALWLWWKPPHRTRSGDALFAELRKRHKIGIRAPRNDQLDVAVALSGAGVLADSAFADYHRARFPSGTSSSDSSGGGGDSDSGGSGCGGGGCGGCGGGGD